MRIWRYGEGALLSAFALVCLIAATGCGDGPPLEGATAAVDEPPPVVNQDPPPIVDEDPPPVVNEDPPPCDEEDPPPVVDNEDPPPDQEDPPPDPVSISTETQLLAEFWMTERFNRTQGGPIDLDTQYEWLLRAKAKKDECFMGVGQPYAPPPDAEGNCLSGGEPKVNDSYIWGITEENNRLFFGTLANTLCAVEQGYLDMASPVLFDEYVCEFGSSVNPRGDNRAPNLFMYDVASGQLTSLNPTGVNAAAEALRVSTGGFRSAGSLDGVAFVAGAARGINMFAFDAATGALIGNGFQLGGSICDTPANPGQPRCPGHVIYNNVRQWAVADGELYLGVGTQTDIDPDPLTTVWERGGAVLKWVGDKASPYQFVEVGHLPADAANMVAHTDNRLYITTWPERALGEPFSADDKPAGLYRSPVIVDPEGLSTLDVDHPDWSTPLWLATSDGRPEHANVPTYDPDRMMGHHIGGGGMASYHGKVYFGTMTVPMYGARDVAETYGTLPGEFLRVALGAHRPIALFEVSFSDGKPTVSMTMGETYLPIWDEEAGGYTIRYDAAHRTGFVPRFGPSGFGNFFNTYTWALRVFQDQVFVGTMDWYQLARINMTTVMLNDDNLPATVRDALYQIIQPGLPGEGADLIRFSDDWMVFEAEDGLGNNRNYGVRNMVLGNYGDSLFVGSANPMNLDPLGGWELIELK